MYIPQQSTSARHKKPHQEAKFKFISGKVQISEQVIKWYYWQKEQKLALMALRHCLLQIHMSVDRSDYHTLHSWIWWAHEFQNGPKTLVVSKQGKLQRGKAPRAMETKISKCFNQTYRICEWVTSSSNTRTALFLSQLKDSGTVNTFVQAL